MQGAILGGGGGIACLLKMTIGGWELNSAAFEEKILDINFYDTNTVSALIISIPLKSSIKSGGKACKMCICLTHCVCLVSQG